MCLPPGSVRSPAVTQATLAPAQAGERGRKKVPWTAAEVRALRDGVASHGTGKWAKILLECDDIFGHQRTSVNLKDKCVGPRAAAKPRTAHPAPHAAATPHDAHHRLAAACRWRNLSKEA